MARILVVDDEAIERKGIRFLFQKFGIPAEIFEAANGAKALDFLKEEKVDVLITDIKMPFMDGMELIENVANQYPSMKIIIYSGYGEFEYAKKAMRYHVSHYILKPVDPAEFENVVGEVLQELENERLEKELREESIHFYKEHILLQAINGVPMEELASLGDRWGGLDFLRQYYCMILLEFNRAFFGKKGDGFRQQLAERISVPFQYLNLNQEQSVFLFGREKDFDRMEMAERLDREIYRIYEEKCFLAVSKCGAKPIDLSETCEALERLMENKFYLPDSRIFLEQEEENQAGGIQVENDLLVKRMQQDIKMKDVLALREHFADLCEKYRGEIGGTQSYVKFVFSGMIKEIYDMLPDRDQQETSRAVDEVYRAEDFSQVMDILGEGIGQMERVYAANPQMVHREIGTVKQYIYANFDKDLSVDLLAEQVFMAPSYLSHIFKKETGQNLSKFIKSLRMEKAKEMLTDSHKKIVNISCDVGYPNVSYFCQSFREYYGVSPQRYRNQGAVNEVSQAEV